MPAILSLRFLRTNLPAFCVLIISPIVGHDTGMLAYDVYSGGVSLKQPAQGVKQMSYETADALVSERIADL